MMYNSVFNTPNGGIYPSTVINPVNEKPQVSTLNEKEEKILASTGGNEFVFTEEEMAVAHCNHAPSNNGQNVLEVENDDGVVAKFRCRRCHTTFEVDRRITESDVSKVCEVMHNILNTIKTYLGSEISPQFARDVFSIDAAFPKLPKLYSQARKSIEQKVAALNQQFQYANPGAYFGQVNPYQTAFANGLNSPSAQFQYNQYAAAAYPTFNGNGMPQQMYGYTGQPMNGMPANPYAAQTPQMVNPYAPQQGYAPSPVGGLMTADSNPLYTSQTSGVAPEGTGTYSVPAPNSGMMFNSVVPSNVSVNPAAPMAGTTTQATPQMNIPTVGSPAPALPPVTNPTPAAAPVPNAATPVGNTSTITL